MQISIEDSTIELSHSICLHRLNEDHIYNSDLRMDEYETHYTVAVHKGFDGSAVVDEGLRAEPKFL